MRCLARGITAAAGQVHHTMGQSQEHAFDRSTFEALCGPCHSAETRARQAAQEAGGEGIR